MRSDGRLEQAKAIPIWEIAGKLGLSGLRPAGVEKVGPCPACGGHEKRDADRFSINPPRGVWNCRRCNKGGDGVDLVCHALGCDFKAALAYLVGDADVAPDPAELERRRKAAAKAEAEQREYAEKARARAIRDAREIWGAAAPGAGTLAEAYLAARGVRFPAFPPTLRFLPDHPHVKKIGNRLEVLHRGPCMIAAVQNAAGRVVAVHQTWLDADRIGKKAVIFMPDGAPAPSKMVRGSKKGGAIRLTALGKTGVMIMGEGIETTGSALAAGVKPAAAFWAGVDLGNMAGRQVKVAGKRHSGLPDLADDRAWLPPEGVKQLVFIQDGDSDPAATRAKLLAGVRRAMAVRPGLRGWIVAAEAGRDLNDMRMEQIGGAEHGK